MDDFLQVAGAIFMVIGIVILAFYSTKWLGKRMGGQTLGGRYLSVIERLSLGQDKSLAIVRLGGKIFLIGVAPGSVTNLGELSEDDLVQIISAPQNVSFGDALKDSLKKYGNFGRGNRGGDHE